MKEFGIMVLDCGKHPIDDLTDRLRIDVVCEDQELIATISRDHIPRSSIRFENPSYLEKDLIALLMPEVVINRLKVVEVET